MHSALDWLDRTYQRPLLFAGFSFGSYVGLRASCADMRVVARIALGLPVRAASRDYTYEFLHSCPGPMLFVSGSDDEFCPPRMLQGIAGTNSRRTVISVADADHFFQGTPDSPSSKLGEMQIAIREWLGTEGLFPPTHPALQPRL